MWTRAAKTKVTLVVLLEVRVSLGERHEGVWCLGQEGIGQPLRAETARVEGCCQGGLRNVNGGMEAGGRKEAVETIARRARGFTAEG